MSITDILIYQQYPVVLLLIVLSVQASRALRIKSLRIIAFAWLANLVNLIIVDRSPNGVVEYFGLKFIDSLMIANVATPFAVLSSVLFICAVISIRQDAVGKKAMRFDGGATRRGNRSSVFRRLLRPILVVLKQLLKRTTFLGLFITAIIVLAWTYILLENLDQSSFLLHVITIAPNALFTMGSLTCLLLYFKYVDSELENRNGMLFFGIVLYIFTQLAYFFVGWCGFFKYEGFGDLPAEVGFLSGFLSKGLILLGYQRLFVIQTEESISKRDKVAEEQELASKTKKVLEELLHEVSTPMLELAELFDNPKRNLNDSIANITAAVHRALGTVDAVRAMHFQGLSPEIVIANASSFGPAQTSTENLNTLVEIARMSVKNTRKEDVCFTTHYSGRCHLKCVPSHIVNLVINIFRNCYDSFLEADGNIVVRTTNVKKQGKVKLTITDDGEGICRDTMSKIYTSGFSTRGKEGRGMGLPIARKLVLLNDGDIEILSPVHASEKGISSGTRVIMTFPRVTYTSEGGKIHVAKNLLRR